MSRRFGRNESPICLQRPNASTDYVIFILLSRLIFFPGVAFDETRASHFDLGAFQSWGKIADDDDVVAFYGRLQVVDLASGPVRKDTSTFGSSAD
jgi:hypothetical protein